MSCSWDSVYDWSPYGHNSGSGRQREEPTWVRTTDYCRRCGESPGSGSHVFDHDYEFNYGPTKAVRG